MNSDPATHSVKRRFVPVWWYLLLCLAPLAAAVGARATDAFGDEGMHNVLGALGLLLSITLWFAWFVFASGAAVRTRVVAAAGAALIIVGLATTLRFEGVSGAMIPRFAWRWAPPAAELAAPELKAPAAVAAPATALDLTVTASTDYPGFLGARRDLTVRGVRLARDWENQPPELLWKQPIGAGWSAFAIVNGVAITQEQRGDQELVTAYDLKTGKLRWSHTEAGRKNHPVGGLGPRATPLVNDGRVYALGGTGILVCLNGADGALLWRKDVPAEFGITPEREASLVDYGRSTSPLVVGDQLILPVGGEDPARMPGIVAFDKVDGTLRWEGPPRHISCAAPSVATLAGRQQILVVNEASLSGHDLTDGKLLWEHPRPARTSADPNVSQPRVVGEDTVFISKGYGLGSTVLRITESTAGAATPLNVEVVWASRRALRTKFTNVAIRDGHAYGLSDGILECIALETGERAWKAGRYGHGQVLLVDDLLLLLAEEGELLLIEATPERPNQVLGRIAALEGKTWNNPALSGDLLAVRNAQEAAVYRLPLAAAR